MKLIYFKSDHLIFCCAMAIAAMYGCSGSNQGFTQPHLDQDSFFDRISGVPILNAELHFDQAELWAHIEDEGRVPAHLVITDPFHMQLPIRISARGVTRKKICLFPPLMLRFDEDMLDSLQWAPFKKYRMVNHCVPEDTSNELLLREYLVYQLYEVVHPVSLRSQLSLMNYQAKRDSFTHYCFILEHEEELADRFDAHLVEDESLDLTKIDTFDYQKLVLFQYMVGNTDWNLHEQHNIRILDDGERIYLVPYDFDFCGLVNAPYAVPYPSLPVKEVRERFFQYRVEFGEDLTGPIEYFSSLKTSLLEKIQSFPLLSLESKSDLIQYLEEFYRVIEGENLVTKPEI